MQEQHPSLDSANVTEDAHERLALKTEQRADAIDPPQVSSAETSVADEDIKRLEIKDSAQVAELLVSSHNGQVPQDGNMYQGVQPGINTIIALAALTVFTTAAMYYMLQELRDSVL